MGNENEALDGFDAVVPSSGKSYILPGSGTLTVDYVKRKTAAEAYSGKDTFIVAFTVDEHTPVEGGEKMLAGSSASYVVCHNKKYPTMYAGDIKKFIGAADGTEPGKVTTAMLEYVISEEQPFKGHKVRFFAKNRPTDSGKDFTNIEWKPIV